MARLQTICDLLSEQVPAVGNASVERYCGKMRAILAFLLGPGGHTRNCGSRQAAENMQQAVVGSYRANFAPVVASFRAQPDQLNQSTKILGAKIRALNAGDFPNAIRQLNSST